MKNISNQICAENQNIFYVQFFFLNHAVYDLKWKNILEPGRPQMTIRRIRIACWIHKATNRHSVYVIFIVFLLQWLHERTSMLNLYVQCLFCEVLAAVQLKIPFSEIRSRVSG
jgi:hypothetical protein